MARRKATTSQNSTETSRESSPNKYRLLVDLSYGDKRVKAGRTVTDIPEQSIGWLLEGNYIRKVG